MASTICMYRRTKCDKKLISQLFGIVWLHITDRQEIFYSWKKLISLVIMTQLIFCTLYPQLIGVIISYIC